MPEHSFERRGPRLRRLPDGRWAETRPDRCPPRDGCGLPWPAGVAGRVLVGTQKCRCTDTGSHRSYQCERCGHTVYMPPLTESCTKTTPMTAPDGQRVR